MEIYLLSSTWNQIQSVSVLCDMMAANSAGQPAQVMSNSTKLLNPSGAKSLIVFTVLALAWLAGFSSRLFAVIRFESIIHEFDPW